MHRRSWIVIGLIVVAGLVGTLASGCGQSEAETPAESPASTPAAADSTNAADEYRSLYAAIDSALVQSLRDHGNQITGEMRRLVPGARIVIDRLVWATTLDRCDWGVDYSGHPEDIALPHLAELRTLTHLLGAHVRLALESGNTDDAADGVVAIVRLSDHVGGKYGIERLVATAILATSANLATEFAGRWSDDHRSELLREYRRMDRSDPTGLEQALAHESVVFPQHGMPDPDAAWYRSGKEQIVDSLDKAIAALGG